MNSFECFEIGLVVVMGFNVSPLSPWQTALHLATHLQQLDIMRKLLLAGAAIDIADHKGNTPLHIAAKFSSTRPLEEIAKYTSIQAVLEVAQMRNNNGLSCVHVAAKNGNMEILRKLQHLGIDMDMQVGIA